MSTLIPSTNRGSLPREEFSWGWLQWLCNSTLFPDAKQTLGICEIQPRRRNALHFHPNCEELLTVLSGAGRHSFDGVWIELSAGMTIHVSAGVRHNFENTGDVPLTCLIAFSSGERETVFLEDC